MDAMIRGHRPIGSSRRSAAPTYIKEWREHLGLSQQAVCGQLLADHDITLSPSHLSRIERGEKQYNQRVLEALAKVMKLRPADLLQAHPATNPGPLLELWVDLAPADQSRLMEMIKVMFRRPAG